MGDYHIHQTLRTELFPGGHHWSACIQRDAVLQLKALGENVNVSLFCVDAEDKQERYNMPNSFKTQHTTFLSTGHIFASDPGRAMISIVSDEPGWNDVICAPTTARQLQAQFGTQMRLAVQSRLHVELAGKSDLLKCLVVERNPDPLLTGPRRKRCLFNATINL